MKREIKFRAWDGEKMVSPDYVTRTGFGYWKENSIPCGTANIMQYTGLKDKNGKEIYEGDIVKWKTSEQNEKDKFYEEQKVICFRNGSFGLQEWVIDENKKLKYHHYTIENFRHKWYYVSEEIEIIGNVYENPELLER